MRNIITLIIGFFVMSAAISFTYSDAEARSNKRNNDVCTCDRGTLTHKCVKHGNVCTYQGAHQHENNQRRDLRLPLFCEVNGQSFLVYASSCKLVKKQVAQQQRRIAAQQREEQRYQRNIQRGMNNIPIISDFQREIRNENRRLQNQARSNVRREIRDTVRGWYGR